MTAGPLLGRRAEDLLPAETIHTIRDGLQFLNPHRGVEVIYDLGIAGSENHFDASVHKFRTR